MSKRNKSKDNPYTLKMEKDIYVIEFIDNTNQFQKVEVSKDVYEAFDKFELEDISQIHKFRSHIEHLELSEEELNSRMLDAQTTLEELVEQKIMMDDLKVAIDSLSETQKRRIKMYYFEDMKLREIAEIEHCSIMSAKESIDTAILKLQKK